MSNELVVKYKDSREQEVILSFNDVKKYICRLATDQEIYMFLQLCKFQGLNPFLREVYLVKYTSDDPATIVIGKELYLKKAEKHKSYDGFKAGIVVINSDGRLEYREGSIKLDNEILIGGWAEVYRKDRKIPIKAEVKIDEYIGKKKDGSITKMWKSKEATMIRKVALVQAMREAFTLDLGAGYDEAEINTIPEPLPQEEIQKLKEDDIVDGDIVEDNGEQTAKVKPQSPQQKREEYINTGQLVPPEYWDNNRDINLIGGKGHIVKKEKDGKYYIYKKVEPPKTDATLGKIHQFAKKLYDSGKYTPEMYKQDMKKMFNGIETSMKLTMSQREGWLQYLIGLVNKHLDDKEELSKTNPVEAKLQELKEMFNAMNMIQVTKEGEEEGLAIDFTKQKYGIFRIDDFRIYPDLLDDCYDNIIKPLYLEWKSKKYTLPQIKKTFKRDYLLTGEGGEYDPDIYEPRDTGAK